MKTFYLLMITISGIAAIPSEQSLQSNINANHIDSDSENSNRIKRDIIYASFIRGTLDSFSYNDEDSAIGFFATVLPTEREYYDDTYHITRDLKYTSWADFLTNYTVAAFQGETKIQFSRNDKEKGVIEKLVTPQPVELSKIILTDENVEESYYLKNPTVPASGYSYPVMPPRDVAYFYYRETLFDEAIWVGISRVAVKIHLTLEGYKKNENLLLKVAYRVDPSRWFTNSGMSLKVENLSDLELRNF